MCLYRMPIFNRSGKYNFIVYEKYPLLGRWVILICFLNLCGMKKHSFNLADIPEKEKVIVKDIKDHDLKINLNRLGIFPNTEILVSKKSLFGSPIAIIYNDMEIALRKETAQFIEVQPVH